MGGIMGGNHGGKSWGKLGERTDQRRLQSRGPNSRTCVLVCPTCVFATQTDALIGPLDVCLIYKCFAKKLSISWTIFRMYVT